MFPKFQFPPFFSFALIVFLLIICGANRVFAACSLNTNLIVNPDAESDQSAPGNNSDTDVSGWEPETGSFTVTRYGAAGGYPTASDPGSANRGNFFFSGGNGGTTSSGTQTIDLSGCAAQIDAGALAFNLSGYLGGFQNSDENARLTLNFRNASNMITGTSVIGPVLAADRSNLTGLLQRATSGTVPAGTRSVEAVLLMTFISGSDNDGYADNLSLTVANPVISSGQIVYSRAPNGVIDNNTATVWAINPDGTSDHQITSGDQPRLSPDGNYLLFRRKSGANNGQNYQDSLYLRNMMTGAENLIYSNGDYIVNYDFAPTGGKIYFDYGCVIIKMDYDGNNQQTIDNNCFDDAPTARKTDSLLAFHGYNGEIFTSNPDGSNRQAVANTAGNNYSPSWSNNGQFIYYTHYIGSGTYPYYFDSLYKIKPDGTSQTLLKALTGSDRFAIAGVESADGTKIYLPANIGGVNGIYAVATGGSGTISAPIAAGSEVDFVGGIAPATIAPPSGIIGWWAGDGDTRDVSGNGNDAAPAAGTNAPTYAVGKVGQSFALDGGLSNSLQFASIPDSSAIRPQSLTIEGWGKLTSVDSAAPTFFGKAVGGGNSDSYVVWYQSGTLHGAICDADDNCGQLNAPSFSLNVWHHIAFTFNDPGGAATKTAVLYIDGVAVSSGTTSIVAGYDTHPALIGGDYDFGSIKFGWTGGIDELSLYNRALSATEIQAINNAGINGKMKSAPATAGVNSHTQVGDATITFSNATTAGTITDYTIDPATAGTLPSGDTQTGLAYDISTTAAYSGAITECFHLPAITDASVFSRLKVLHLESGTLVDRTVSTDFTSRFVCGQTTSLSPFVIANGLAPTAANVSIGGRVMTAKGRGIAGVRVSLTDQTGATRSVLTGAFGSYLFDHAAAGKTYVISVRQKRYSFNQPTQIVSVSGSISDLNFVAN